MATKRDKRVAEINALKDKLPESNFLIEITSNDTTVKCNSYFMANRIINSVCKEADAYYSTSFDSRYLFSALSTDKTISKNLKIRVSSIIHQNYKTK